jgi:hypothetical protein
MPELAAYDSFTVDLAYQLEPHQTAGSLEEGFTLHYQPRTEDALLQRLSRGFYAGSDLQAYYDDEVARLRKAIAWEWGAYLGAWFPQDRLSVLGRHPEVGLRFGRWFERTFLRLAAEYRFLSSRSPYLVWYEDEPIVTEHYAALQVVLETGIALATIGRVGFEAQVAIGWEGIDYHAEIEDWLGSPVIGLGLGTDYLLDPVRGSRLFCDLRWEYTDFDTRGGTILEGHAWNLRVGYAQTIDLDSRARLADLQALRPR